MSPFGRLFTQAACLLTYVALAVQDEAGQRYACAYDCYKFHGHVPSPSLLVKPDDADGDNATDGNGIVDAGEPGLFILN